MLLRKGIAVIVSLCCLICLSCEPECAKEGEMFSEVLEYYPNRCCSGLTEWHSGMDTRVSIADTCYATGLVAGAPVGKCIDCGNGVCDDIENVCNCPQDCQGGENSEYERRETFCSSDFYTTTIAPRCDEGNADLPVCGLCEASSDIIGVWKLEKICSDYDDEHGVPNDCLELTRYYSDFSFSRCREIVAEDEPVFAFEMGNEIIAYVNQYLIIDEDSILLTSRLRDLTSPLSWGYNCYLENRSNEVCQEMNYCKNDLVWCPDLEMSYQQTGDMLQVVTGPGSKHPNAAGKLTVLALSDAKMTLRIGDAGTTPSVSYAELIRASEEEIECTQTTCLVQATETFAESCGEPGECRKRLTGGEMDEQLCSQLDILF